MRSYIMRRVVLLIPTLFLVTLIVFFSVRFVPGSVVDIMSAQLSAAGGESISRAQVEEMLGLDKPMYIQYFNWLGKAVQGDLGTSLWQKRDIVPDILRKIPISLELGFLAILTGLCISLPIGIYSAIRQDTIGDYVGRSVAILFIAVPSFWLATMVVVFPAGWWGWSPQVQYMPITENLGANLLQFIIPGVIMGMVMSGTSMRMTRTMMLEVLRQDYIRTAWSKGLRERMVVIRHALRNALIPVVTIVGMQIPVLLGGSVIMEQIFNLPGMGRFMVEALNARDYPIISGINLCMASVILCVNLTVDLTYSLLDPRIKYR
ncbi:MAG: ABC transporter permease [Dehalococcoidales bacterium]|nr:ABC transporter permease [Dehalococcoidales bacterium]